MTTGAREGPVNKARVWKTRRGQWGQGKVWSWQEVSATVKDTLAKLVFADREDWTSVISSGLPVQVSLFHLGPKSKIKKEMRFLFHRWWNCKWLTRTGTNKRSLFVFLCLGLNDTGKIFYIYTVDLFFEIFAFNECAMLWEWLLIISFDFTDLQMYARTSSPVFVIVILSVFIHGKGSARTSFTFLQSCDCSHSS